MKVLWLKTTDLRVGDIFIMIPTNIVYEVVAIPPGSDPKNKSLMVNKYEVWDKEKAEPIMLRLDFPIEAEWLTFRVDVKSLREAFLKGAKWWEYKKSGGFTMWQSDQNYAWEAAKLRYKQEEHYCGKINPSAPQKSCCKGEWQCDECRALDADALEPML